MRAAHPRSLTPPTCSKMLRLLSLLLAAPFCTGFTFRVGTVIGNVSSCSEMEDANLGYKFSADQLGTSEDKSMSFTDAAGKKHIIKFEYLRYNDDCEATKHMQLVNRLIFEDRVHFMLGSTPVFAKAESILADDAQRLIYHCCVGPDPIYEMDMKHVYGIQASNTRYSLGSVKSMALAGDVKKLFIFYLADNIFTSSTCEAAVEYSNEVLKELSPSFDIVEVVSYTGAEAAADPEFYRKLVSRAIGLGADAVCGCDFKGPGFEVAKAFADRDYYLKAMFLTVAPAYEDFVTTLKPKATENVLTAVQWHPAMKFADSFFGTARDYSSSYEDKYGRMASYVSAGASAALYSLASAIQNAFGLCSLVRPEDAISTEQLLFDPSVLNCHVNKNEAFDHGHQDDFKGSGYDLVMLALARQKLATFFGPVEFNLFRRNVAMTPATTQIQDGEIQATLPLDVANKALVMPMPPPEEPEEGPEYIGTLQKEAFIVVVVVVIGSVLLLALALLLWFWAGQRRSRMLERLLVISPDDLLILCPPVRLGDGSWEDGKAMHRNARVGLMPLEGVKMTGELRRVFSNPMRAYNEHASASLKMGMGASTGVSQRIPSESIPDVVKTQLKNLRLKTPAPSLEPRVEIDLEAADSESGKGPVGEGLEEQPPDYQSYAMGENISAPLPRSPFAEPQQQQQHQISMSSSQLPQLFRHTSSSLRPSHRRTGFTGLDTREVEMEEQMYKASSAQLHNAALTSPPLSQTQILRLLWRSKCLQHPSVVPVVGILWSLPCPNVPPNQPVLVTECQELGALSSVVENKTMELDAVKLLDVCKDLAQALAYLHAERHPRLRPVLQPRLAGMMLNKHCRAKLHVPLTSLLDVLSFRSSPCNPCMDMQASPDPSVHVQASTLSNGSLQQKMVGVHKEELADVQNYGLKMAGLLSAGHLPDDFSTIGGGGDRLSIFSLKPQCDANQDDLVPGSCMPKAVQQILETQHGSGIAEVLLSCCALDSRQRPCFTLICERLEEAGADMIRHAQQAVHRQKRLASVSVGGGTAADNLLYEVFPKRVAEALKSGRLPDPEPFPCVSLFFADIVGYTDLCSILEPCQILNLLHRLYSRFDNLVEDFDLLKVGTVGDSFIVAGNVREPLPDTHAVAVAQFAFCALEAAENELVCPDKPELGPVRVRIGLHSGSVMGAVVGTMNRRYSLFGDAVNVASRMESTSLAGHIQCSAPFIELLRQQWPQSERLAVPQGARLIKGKGTMETFFLFPREQDAEMRRRESLLLSKPSLAATSVMRRKLEVGTSSSLAEEDEEVLDKEVEVRTQPDQTSK